MHHGPAPDRSGSADPHGVGRAIPDLGARARGAGDRGRGAAPPDLEDGQKDHRGFGDPRQQGARGDRGPLPVRPGLRVGRGGRAPAVGPTRVRRVRGRVGAGTGGIPEHGAADSLRPHASRARPRLGDAALRSRGGGRADLRADPPRDLRRLRPGARGGRGGRHDPDGVQRRERSGGGGVPRGENPLRAHRADDRARAPIVPADRGEHPRGGARGGRGGAPPGAGVRMLLTLAAFAVVLGVLIFVHEAGHFMAAKAVGIQVLRFSLGFGRPIVAWHRGETEYWISWLPIGGYVKMAGMEDEGMSGDLEGGKSSVPVDPARAFDRQPIWARAVVLAAGVTMNVVLAFVVYTGLAATVGASRTNTTQVDTVWASLLPKGGEALAQLRQGDRIVAINGDTVRTWEDVLTELATEPAPLRIAVAGRPAPIVLDVPRGDQEARGALLRALESFFPCRIDVVTPGLPADRAGLKPGDLVVRANGDTVLSWTQVTRLVRRSVHRPVAATVWRDGRTVDVRLVPERQFGPDPHTGAEVAYGFAGIGATTPITRQRFGVIGAIGEGARNTVTS